MSVYVRGVLSSQTVAHRHECCRGVVHFTWLSTAKCAGVAASMLRALLLYIFQEDHAKNKIVSRMITSLVHHVSGIKNTMSCAGAMPVRQDFPATTRILRFQATLHDSAYNIILPWMQFFYLSSFALKR